MTGKTAMKMTAMVLAIAIVKTKAMMKMTAMMRRKREISVHFSLF